MKFLKLLKGLPQKGCPLEEIVTLRAPEEMPSSAPGASPLVRSPSRQGGVLSLSGCPAGMLMLPVPDHDLLVFV